MHPRLRLNRKSVLNGSYIENQRCQDAKNGCPTSGLPSIYTCPLCQDSESTFLSYIFWRCVSWMYPFLVFTRSGFNDGLKRYLSGALASFHGIKPFWFRQASQTSIRGVPLCRFLRRWCRVCFCSPEGKPPILARFLFPVSGAVSVSVW